MKKQSEYINGYSRGGEMREVIKLCEDERTPSVHLPSLEVIQNKREEEGGGHPVIDDHTSALWLKYTYNAYEALCVDDR